MAQKMAQKVRIVGLVLGVFVFLVVTVAVGISAGQFGSALIWSRLTSVGSYASVETTYDSVQEFSESIEIVDIAYRSLGTDTFGERVTFKYTVRNLTDDDITVNSWRTFVPVFVDADGFAIVEAATGHEYIVPANGEYTHTGVEFIEAHLWEQIVDLRIGA